MRERISTIERDQRLLEKTLREVARESGVSMAGPCVHCNRAHTLIEDGVAYCPACRNTWYV